jgi:hypothetical protein
MIKTVDWAAEAAAEDPPVAEGAAWDEPVAFPLPISTGNARFCRLTSH